MKISRAISTLKRNGWSVDEGREIVATKRGQRAIHLIPNGSRESDTLAVISVRNLPTSGQQFDTSCDSRYCDTIKEAMRCA
jgi:hypothetical protein